MQKYVVKNCPAYRKGKSLSHYCKSTGCCINTYVDGMDCTTISNCLIKQVIEKCKEAVRTYDNEEFYEDDCDRFFGESAMAQEILELFEVEE